MFQKFRLLSRNSYCKMAVRPYFPDLSLDSFTWSTSWKTYKRLKKRFVKGIEIQALSKLVFRYLNKTGKYNLTI